MNIVFILTGVVIGFILLYRWIQPLRCNGCQMFLVRPMTKRHVTCNACGMT